MSFPHLQAFIDKLEKSGELTRIREFVSPHLQITEIADRLIKNNGQALLFENNGTKFPLLINAMGSEKRICMALGVETLDDPAKQIEALIGGFMTPRESLFSKLALLPTPVSYTHLDVYKRQVWLYTLFRAGNQYARFNKAFSRKVLENCRLGKAKTRL